MKALVLQEYNKFVYTDVAEPQIEENEVLVEVKACGICGSDVHGMDGSTGRRIPPIIMGHEAAGVIARVGPRVRGWRTGERVTFDSTMWCGECWRCRRGEINLCEHRMVLGVSCAEYRRHGAFARFVAIPQHILYRVPADVSFAQAAMTEPLAVAFHGVHLARPEVGESAVVVGAGMIGLLIIQVLTASGCQQIIALDVDPSKLSRARELGASAALDSRNPDTPAELLRLTDGRGAHMALEAVGISAAVQSAVSAVRMGGRVVLVGNLSAKVELPLQLVVTRQLALQGSCASQGEYDACLDLIARKRINVDAFMSARAPLEEGASWFDRLHRQEPGLMKVILEP
ncbi:MAG TPA: galactitol-1-phosphate 5-dehydrogenase [Spirochaetia bacterium]|nr:galactitol-1-phosphate 5-dehydrogenase [Spirochaetia bacterium]